jgi:hypothetical protein
MSNYNLAELRCYEKSNFGIDVSDCLSYAFVEKVGSFPNYQYQNMFKDEVYPVLKRNKVGRQSSYYFEEDNSNVFSEYGESGLCWVITNVGVSNLPLEDMKNIVIFSDHYFKDRKDLMEELFESDFNREMRKTFDDDLKRYDDLVRFLEDKGIDLDNRGKKLVR